MRRAPHLAVIMALLLAVAGSPAPARAASDPAEYCFAETGYCIAAEFAAHWASNGGLAQQGYPITDVISERNPLDGKTYRTQYFERARFEWHPDNRDPQYRVLLGLLGDEQFRARYPRATPAGRRGEVCFPEVGRCTSAAFFAYWERNGGLAQQGYPVSDLLEERDPRDGRLRTVQYFERARFEDHAADDPRHPVLLGLLGREQLAARYPAPPRAVAEEPPLDPEERAFFILLNEYRTSRGVAPLQLSRQLTAAAIWFSHERIAHASYTTHYDSRGRNPILQMCDFHYCNKDWYGQNVYDADVSARAALTGFINSPTHEKVQTSPNYRVVGIARVPRPEGGWAWTINFGSGPD